MKVLFVCFVGSHSSHALKSRHIELHIVSHSELLNNTESWSTLPRCSISGDGPVSESSGGPHATLTPLLRSRGSIQALGSHVLCKRFMMSPGSICTGCSVLAEEAQDVCPVFPWLLKFHASQHGSIDLTPGVQGGGKSL